jgi:hypothetical protein
MPDRILWALKGSDLLAEAPIKATLGIKDA